MQGYQKNQLFSNNFLHYRSVMADKRTMLRMTTTTTQHIVYPKRTMANNDSNDNKHKYSNDIRKAKIPTGLMMIELRAMKMT